MAKSRGKFADASAMTGYDFLRITASCLIGLGMRAVFDLWDFIRAAEVHF